MRQDLIHRVIRQMLTVDVMTTKVCALAVLVCMSSAYLQVGRSAYPRLVFTMSAIIVCARVSTKLRKLDCVTFY